MSDQDRPGYTPPTYVRPNQTYCCGRSGKGGKACWQGPSGSQCGGASQCRPARVGDRWECRRPKLAGGECSEGPLPDGSCCQTLPPCTPKRSMRSKRGLVFIIAVLIVLLTLFVGVDPKLKSAVNPAAIDAGNLSSVHAGFTAEDGCASCHVNAPHQAGGWLLSAFGASDTSGKCVECHRFEGPAMRAHNVEKTKNPKYAGAAMQDQVSCASCHTEHKGSNVKLSQVDDTACAGCHKPAFDHFEKGHPAFSKNFSSSRPTNVFYDHAAHGQDYFVNPKHLKGAGRDAKLAAMAKSDCTTCHSVDDKTREMKMKTYDQVCAGCHQNQVKERELVLLQPEQLTAAASSMLNLPRDGDEEANTTALKKLWSGMAAEGRSALAKHVPEKLIAGLGNDVARKAGAAWSKGGDLEPLDDPAAPGWSAGENSEGNPSLFYRANKHTDPVLMAWMEHLRAGMKDKDADKRAMAKEAMAEFLDKQTGPGACGKCHAAGLRSVADGKPGSEWQYAAPSKPALPLYSHAKHLNVGNPGANCASCHQLDAGSKYPKYFTAKVVPANTYESNFAGIAKETCVSCHKEGKVDASCQTCHAYHPKHELNIGFKHKELVKK